MTESHNYEEIIKAAKEAESELTVIANELAGNISRINSQIWGENDEQKKILLKKERKKLRAAEAEIGSALDKLTYETLRKLDNATKVQAFQEQIARVNEELNDNLDELDEIKKGAEKFKNFVETVEKVVTGIAGFISSEEAVSKESESAESENKKAESTPGEGENTPKKPSG